MKTIEANGVGFAYLEEGSGPLVVLVHGFPDTAHTWDRVMPALAAAGYRVVAPFTRGYHPTPIPADGKYDADTLGADVAALIEQLGGNEPAIVVGHDWGASAAYAVAAMRPELVRKLVTIGIPHPRSVTPTPWLAWKLRHFVFLGRKRAADKMLRADLAYVDTLVSRWSPAWQVPPGETDRVKAAFREPGCLDAALGYYRQSGARLPPSQRKPIEVPSVAFAGLHDSIFKPKAYEKARKMYRSTYEVVAMPGGHFMHREHPEHFIRELVRVLAGDQARAA
jgi:pimeloyl-ACP methyl ester carboxylesterase